MSNDTWTPSNEPNDLDKAIEGFKTALDRRKFINDQDNLKRENIKKRIRQDQEKRKQSGR